MTILTSSTAFVIGAAITTITETVDLFLMPENDGVDAFRELHYPNNIFPPIVYLKNPDKWENFDTVPLTARPSVGYTKTLTAGQLIRWDPYIQDNTVKESWEGGGGKMSMQAYFFRRLWEYYVNPPDEDYIIWYPKDRTPVGYEIEIVSLSVSGEDAATIDYGAISNGYILDSVTLVFRIIGEA